MIRLLVNVAGFYAGWFACVLGAAEGRPWLGPAVLVVVLAVHLALHPVRSREAALILIVTATGVLVDTGMLLAGVLRFEGGTAVTPVFLAWIAALWANLAAILGGCLRWLARWPWLALVLGAAGGPATYWGGAELGAIGLHEQPWISLTALAVEWGILMPTLVWLAHHWHRTAAAARPNEAKAQSKTVDNPSRAARGRVGRLATLPEPSDRWDAGDRSCGELALALRNRMRALAAGACLELITRDLGAPEDIPAWCRLTGHVLLRAEHPTYLIAKKDRPEENRT